MKTKTFAVIGMVVFVLFSLVGCSNNPLSKVQIIDNGIKTNYIIGEELEVNEFSLKVTFKNNEEKIYKISEDMIKLSDIDNYKVGTQDLNILVDYYGTEIELIVSVTFDLPNYAYNIINLIDQLPDKEDVNFSHEFQIEQINNEYLKLEEKYKSYIINYNKYMDSKDQLDWLKQELLTSDFINKRFILKLNLDNVFYSLNESDYDYDEWNKILEIYDDCLTKLYLNENYQIIDEVVNSAINEINSVHSRTYKNIALFKEEVKGKILKYRTLLDDNYSIENQLKLNLIVCSFIDDLDKLKNIGDIKNLYNNTINKLDSIDTAEEEAMVLLNQIIENQINILKAKLRDIELSKYSEDNKKLIINCYNESLDTIKTLTQEEMMSREIQAFEYKISNIKTIEIEERELFEQEKKQALDYVRNFNNQIDIYKYDSKNRMTIKTAILESIASIESCETISDIREIKNQLVNYINDIPTMFDQAIENLPNRIDSAIENVDDYLEQLDCKNYSKENWEVMQNLADNLKEYFKENITIYTYDIEIENKINKFIKEIELIMTLEEETQFILNNSRMEAIDVLDKYFKSLNNDDFDTEIISIVKNKINDTIKTIRKMNDINMINRLVEDTISAIEDAKKL